jgi:signal transduction histidine kinase
LAEEKERHRIANEVHDNIGQNLAFAKIKLEQLRMSSSPDCSKPVAEIIKLINDTIEDTRSLVSELGSPILYELGLVPALEWIAKKIQDQHGFEVDFRENGLPGQLNENVELFLFQAIRELLTNVAKHAEANCCTISLKLQGKDLRVDIVDDGKGFDTEVFDTAGSEGKGFGYFSIRERVESLGGTLQIDSRPNGGTRVFLIVPLNT